MKANAAKFLILPGLIALVLAVAPQAAAQQNANVSESASGHGSYSVGTKQSRQFSFSAVKHRDGTVTGNAVIQNPSFDFRGQLEVTCLRITQGAINPVTGQVGTRADVGGVVRRSNDAGLPEGTRGFFTVFDHGEPGKGRDTISPVFFDFDVPASACLNILGDPTAPSNLVQIVIEAGNVQVRP